MPDIRKELNDYIDELVIQFEDTLVGRIRRRIPEFDPDWVAEDLQENYEDARRNFIDSLTDDILLAYYPEEEVE